MENRTAHDSPSRHRRHAGRTRRAARAGLVLAVIAVTATVGIGTWVLGSSAPRAEVTPPAPTRIVTPQPPLSIAPPPDREPPHRSSRTKSATVKKRVTANR